MKLITIAAIFFGMMSLNARALDIEFDNISKKDLEKIIDEFSANFHHTSVSGAGTLGSLFGFELGLVGGITKTPEVDKLVKSQNANAKAEQVPHASLLGVLTVPLGITAELGLIPQVGSEDFKFSRYSVGVKWTLTELLLSDLPVSLAIKAHHTKADLEFEQLVSGQQTKVKFEDSISGAMFLVSKNFLLVEPYAGIGYLMADGQLDVAGNNTIFNFTTAQSAGSKASSVQYVVGAEVKLMVLKLGAEYSNQFDADRYSLKLAFYF